MPYPVNVEQRFVSGEASLTDFQTKEAREERRINSKNFWQDSSAGTQ